MNSLRIRCQLYLYNIKTKNLFVNGYVYEELNDFVKSLEKKAGIEISE